MCNTHTNIRYLSVCQDILRLKITQSCEANMYMCDGLTISIKQLQTVLDAVVCLLTFRLL